MPPLVHVDDYRVNTPQQFRLTSAMKSSNLVNAPSLEAKVKNSERKNVSFQETITIHSVPAIGDYTPEEAAAVWMSEADMSRIREENLIAMDMLRADPRGLAITDDEDVCTRGIEFGIPQVRIRIAEVKKASIRAVMMESQLQLEQDAPDPDWIRELYTDYARDNQEYAYQQGLRDAQAVEEIKRQDELAKQLKEENTRKLELQLQKNLEKKSREEPKVFTRPKKLALPGRKQRMQRESIMRCFKQQELKAVTAEERGRSTTQEMRSAGEPTQQSGRKRTSSPNYRSRVQQLMDSY